MTSRGRNHSGLWSGYSFPLPNPSHCYPCLLHSLHELYLHCITHHVLSFQGLRLTHTVAWSRGLVAPHYQDQPPWWQPSRHSSDAGRLDAAWKRVSEWVRWKKDVFFSVCCWHCCLTGTSTVMICEWWPRVWKEKKCKARKRVKDNVHEPHNISACVRYKGELPAVNGQVISPCCSPSVCLGEAEWCRTLQWSIKAAVPDHCVSWRVCCFLGLHPVVLLSLLWMVLALLVCSIVHLHDRRVY